MTRHYVIASSRRTQGGYGSPSSLDVYAVCHCILLLLLLFIFSVQAHRTRALEEAAEQNNGPDGEAAVPNRVSVWPFISKHFVVLDAISDR